jgi:type IV pilus assembly protein PilX
MSAVRPFRSKLADACRRGQRGSVLVVGLIFLALMSLIGVTAYSVATQEERMAGNARDRLRAFEAAEAALRDCEQRVRTMSDADALAFPATDDPHANYPEMYGPPASQKEKWEDLEVVDSNTKSKYWYTSNDPKKYARQLPAGSVPGVSEQPRCIVQRLSSAKSGNASLRAELPQSSASAFAYQVTGRGVGANRSAVVLLQSTFVRD